VRKRSRSRHGTDEARAEDAGHDEPRTEGSQAIGGQPQGGPDQGRGPSGSRRSRSRRQPDQNPKQGVLFDDLLPAVPNQAETEADGEEAKKSRSRRRRERRKANHTEDPAAEDALAREAPAEGAEPAPAKRRDGLQNKQKRHGPPGGRTPEAPRSERARQEKRSVGNDRRVPGIDRADKPFRRADRPGSFADGQRGFADAQRGRSDREGGRGPRRDRPRPAPARDDRPFGLPPIDDDAIPHYVSNVQGLSSRQGPRKPETSVRTLETIRPEQQSLVVMQTLEQVLEETAPLSAKHRASLKGDIRQLWEDLTSDRESRPADYLGSPPALSAYLRYFLPWNVFRLSSLLANADFCLPDKAVIIDIGSGPLTLPIALWAARPELRDVPLTIYCMDRVERVLEAGQAVFETLCMRIDGRLPPWRLEMRKESFGGSLPERAHLLTAANVFNEFFWKDRRPLGERALETARTLLSYIRENGSLFIMEPGDPRSGSFISALRAALLAEGAPPLGPCPHALSCPMPGIFRHLFPPEETRAIKGDPNAAPSRYILPQVAMPKKRDKYPWCHFGVDAAKAPAWLEALSEEAGLPKERAVLSYLWAARGAMARAPVGVPSPDNRSSDRERRARATKGILVRVVSESFALPDGCSGQYACSSLGYTLLRRGHGEEPFGSGDLLEVAASPLQRNDEKSGAVILPS
jgi:hypothetical protein